MTVADVPFPGLVDLAVELRCSTAARPRVSDPHLNPSRRTIDSFWSHVVRSPGDGCFWWVSSISSPDGYGRFNYASGSRQRTVLAHRFAMELAIDGPLDDDVVCEHKCNEPLCVRVDDRHLVRSTQSENVRYAVALGRLAGPLPLDQHGRSRYQRSLDIRAALINGYDPEALYRAKMNVGPQGLLF